MTFYTVLKITVFFVLLVFGTHFIRTWAFNRYEAVTFECSAITVFLSVLLIRTYGFSFPFLILFTALFVMFIGNSYAQWHFYMILQDIIERAFSVRAEYLKRNDTDASVNDSLLTMASVAIMPSFSRFIEESKVFNNPGSFIGLIKSIMKRQRFQKKKYQMRESFADSVNLIGPCKPEIDSMMRDPVHVIPGAIHANDLALDYPDERKGLFSFDILGFGALLIAYIVMLYLALNPRDHVSASVSTADTVVLCLVMIALTFASHILRHFAFARYESVCYEFSFTSLVIVSFGFLKDTQDGSGIPAYRYVILGAAILIFLILSLINRRLDRSLHDKINARYDEVIYKITLETETDRIKRRFLQNLKMISEWAIVPYTMSEKRAGFVKKLMFTKRIKRFEEINLRKRDMPQLTESIIDKVVPEYSDEITEDDFRLSSATLRKTRIINDVLSIGEFAAVFICMLMGLI